MLLSPQSNFPSFDARKVVQSLYQGLLGRPADAHGLDHYLAEVNRGMSLADVADSIASSTEFRARHNLTQIIPPELPDLTRWHPDKYRKLTTGRTVFYAKQDEDFGLLESYITKFRYYDSFGVWNPAIDLDKRVTARIVQGLGAKSCIELGCFTGPVLSILDEAGVDICGVDVSHLAFVLAYPNVRSKMRFGALTELKFDRTFDVFLAMDILEHVSPLDLSAHMAVIRDIVERDGFAYVNSPMMGTDDVFGEAFDVYFPEWAEAGTQTFWRHIDCDEKGWPMHGHLVWASPQWWEEQFARHGLVREREIERSIHSSLAEFFKMSPGRRSLFVLRHEGSVPDAAALSKRMSAYLASPVVVQPELK
jgi:hypothetical protein